MLGCLSMLIAQAELMHLGVSEFGDTWSVSRVQFAHASALEGDARSQRQMRSRLEFQQPSKPSSISAVPISTGFPKLLAPIETRGELEASAPARPPDVNGTLSLQTVCIGSLTLSGCMHLPQCFEPPQARCPYHAMNSSFRAERCPCAERHPYGARRPCGARRPYGERRPLAPVAGCSERFAIPAELLRRVGRGAVWQ